MTPSNRSPEPVTPDAPGPVEADAFGDVRPGTLPTEARTALATLLTQRFITSSKHPAAWDALLAYEDEVRDRLADMFMVLELDRDYEVAFKRQPFEDGVPVLLRRDKPLSREATFLLIYLRQEHAFTDAQDGIVLVSRSQISDFLSRFTADQNPDQVSFERRVDAAIRALDGLGLIEPDADDPDFYTVSPVIVPLIDTNVLARLREVYENAAADGQAGEGRDDREP